jgi:RNA polymerase sigma factor (sigma-70 family)
VTTPPAQSVSELALLTAAAEDGGLASGAGERLLAWLEPRIRLMVAVRLRREHRTEPQVERLLTASRSALFAWLRDHGAPPSVPAFRRLLSDVVRSEYDDWLRTAAEPDAFAKPFDDDAPPSVWDLVHTVTGVDSTPSSNTGRNERIGLLLDDVDALPKKHREVLVLSFFDQLDCGQTAALLGLDRGQAARRIAQAVEALRSRWRRRWRRDR